MLLYLSLLTPLLAIPAMVLLDRLERWTTQAPTTSSNATMSRTPWRSPTPERGASRPGRALVENRPMLLDAASRSGRSPR